VEESVTLPSAAPGGAPDTLVVGTRSAQTTLVVSVSHAVVDAYAGFLPPLLPRIMDELGLSIALVATLAMTFSLASSLLQPVLGWLSDRHGRRAFVVGGPLLSGVFLSMIGLAPSFAVLLALLCVAGLGSAAFHPPGASLATAAGAGMEDRWRDAEEEDFLPISHGLYRRAILTSNEDAQVLVQQLFASNRRCADLG
jgi:hypothetical protein